MATTGPALQCSIHPLDALSPHKYVVVCANYQGQWLLSRHRDRDTWETQGGHIEPGETPLQAAVRELYEESGVTDAQVIPVCAKLEAEIAELDGEEKKMFLRLIGVSGIGPKTASRTSVMLAVPSSSENWEK